MLQFLVAPKVLCFVGGAAAVLLGKKIVDSGKPRDLLVKGLAKGLQLQDCAKEVFQNMKEEANDIYEDAKNHVVKEDE